MMAHGETGVEESVRRALNSTMRTTARSVLAVSGGIDSMVLLDAASVVAPPERLIVATFDHGTGREATRAAALVAERAASLGIECATERARGTLESEAALRAARWRFLRGVASRVGGVVCTAHTEDDQIETVLMRILRGAGARGLAALYARSDVVRPLLESRRRDVRQYAASRGVVWIDDPSNSTPAFLRNRIRHDLLPAVRRVRPSMDADLLAVAREASRWRNEVEAFVSRTVSIRELAGGMGLDVAADALRDVPAASLAILWPAIAARVGLALDRRGTRRLAEFTGRARVGARIQLSGDWQVVRSRDSLQLRASSEKKPTSAPLAMSHTTHWYAWSFRPTEYPEVDDAWVAWLPADRPLVIRPWGPGDAMGTTRSGRARKVKRLLSGAGITGHERAAWPVVVAEDGGEIVWVPGVRRSDAAADPGRRSGLSFICEYVNR